MNTSAAASPSESPEFRDFPFPVSRIQPPYQSFEPIPDIGGLPAAHLAPGTILAMEVADPGRAWPFLPPSLRSLRAAVPTASVILRLPAVPDAAAMELAHRAGQLHLRAVLLEGEPIEASLRRALTRAGDLSGDVFEWLSLRRLSLAATTAKFLEPMFREVLSHRNVSQLTRPQDRAESTMRAHMRREGLPPPRDWLRCARSLHAALRLQAQPRVPVLTTALALGYTDHSQLSREISECFGVRPTDIRPTMGWEWLMDRWLDRHRLLPPRQHQRPPRHAS